MAVSEKYKIGGKIHTRVKNAKGEIVAIFVGLRPDREANARKFKHMDELVKWAVEFVALEDNALKEWANESLTPWTGNEPCMVRLRALKTILAKIAGEPEK